MQYITKKEIGWSTEKEIIERVFKYYREHGFPYFKLTADEKRKEFRSVANFSTPINLHKPGIIKQTMHGLALAWSYFPHSWSIRCNNSISCMDVFNDDELFKKAIKKILLRSDRVSINEVRKVLKYVTQGVSNFRPTVAKYMYDTYGGDGIVWDMSTGYGGRLLGAITSDKIKHYIGTDPAIKSYNGIIEFKKDYDNFVFFQQNSKFFGEFNRIKKIELHCIGSEDFLPEKETLDLCFTSPPYFNCEKYSDEETQSYKKFPNTSLWMRDFIGQTLENCYHGLKPGGTLIINVADVKSYPTLCDDFLKSAKSHGFKLLNTYRMTLSNIQGGNEKYEPIFILEKKS